MADDSGDLAHVVHEVLINKMRELGRRSDAGWVDFTINDTFSLMVDLAAAGVNLSMADFVDTSEHGVQMTYAHGADCEGCKAIGDIVLSVRSSLPRIEPYSQEWEQMMRDQGRGDEV